MIVCPIVNSVSGGHPYMNVMYTCRYDAEMEQIAKAEAAEKKKQDDWYANLGKSELSLKSAYKIQKIWRGYLVRRVWGKVLKKLRKKRLAAKKKGKKK